MMMINNKDPLHEQLGCFGYFGFGGGFALVAFGTADDAQGDTYCNRCPRSKDCWERHRARVRTMAPEMAKLVDELGEKHKGHIDAMMRELLAKTDQTGTHFFEPYTSIMMGNMQDGMQIAVTEQPVPRGPYTLTWPLEKLNEPANT